MLALFGLLAGTAAAKSADPIPWRAAKMAKPKNSGKQMVFPVLGRTQLTNSFGDPRGQGAHQGEDIMAPRKAPAIATEAGRVRFYTGSGRAGCMLYLYGDSGTKYLYIHLNNDLTMENDNRGDCVQGVAFAKGLKDGQRVLAGQPVGFVGDSGDADGISPHLHFEMHPGGGAAIAPYPHLRAAKRLLFYASRGTIFTLAMTGKVVSAGDEQLRVNVATLRGSPMGITLRNLGRGLTITVPVGALVERARQGGAVVPVSLANAKPGESVALWTEATLATSDAQAGKAGALIAERVLLPPA
ncbi:MAG: M23 family metallopeptidase [Actinobacteria bacterium]|nr:M23 family metallopeptidase [Actinomycetota bacterium]